MRARSAVLPAASFGSQAGPMIIFLGLILLGFRVLIGFDIAIVGLLLFALILVFHVVTFPVEFDASRRALKLLRETGIVTGEEIEGTRKVLTAAALTYLAAIGVSLPHRYTGSRHRSRLRANCDVPLPAARQGTPGIGLDALPAYRDELRAHHSLPLDAGGVRCPLPLLRHRAGRSGTEHGPGGGDRPGPGGQSARVPRRPPGEPPGVHGHG